MKVSVICFTVATAAPSVGDDCYWSSGTSGAFAECLPDYYIKGACESGRNYNCKVDTAIGHTSSFGIQCCPIDRNHNYGNTRECSWLGGSSGQEIACPGGQAAFGRCSTSDRSETAGACNKMSHQLKCCSSDTDLDEDKCGWIYSDHGVKKSCPADHVVGGFCGVNNKADCKNNSFVGIRCCPGK